MPLTVSSLAATVVRAPWRRRQTLTPSAPPTVTRAKATTRRRAASMTSTLAGIAATRHRLRASSTAPSVGASPDLGPSPSPASSNELICCLRSHPTMVDGAPGTGAAPATSGHRACGDLLQGNTGAQIVSPDLAGQEGGGHLGQTAVVPAGVGPQSQKCLVDVDLQIGRAHV